MFKNKRYFSYAFLMLISLFMIVGGACQSEKVFEKSGVKVVLDSSFYEKEIMQSNFYLESSQVIFIANREEKSLFAGVVSDLKGYIDAVLRAGNKNSKPTLFEEENLKFYYADYEATVDGNDFHYTMFCFEGASHYYTINFATRKNSAEKYQEKIMGWAKTIVVE